MKRIAHLVAGSGIALTLAFGAYAQGGPPAAKAEHPKGATDDKGKVTEPCGDGSDGKTVEERIALEHRKHDARLTKLAKLEQVAKDGKNDALLTQVARMRDKENLRHERALTRLGTLDERRDAAADRRDNRDERRKDKVEKIEKAKEKAKAKGKVKEKAKDQAPAG